MPKSRLNISGVLLLVVFTLSVNSSSINKNTSLDRSLYTCSNYDQCGACSTSTSCTFVNGACQDSIGTDLQYKSYSQRQQQQYCISAVKSGYIYLGPSNEKSVTIGHQPSAPINSSNSLCEWKFVMEEYDLVTLSLTKSPDNYEDLYIYAMTRNGAKEYHLDELTSCDSGVIDLELKELKYLVIRTDKLSPRSEYSITIQTQGSNGTVLSALVVSIILCTVMLSFAIITFVLLYLSFKQWAKERRARTEAEAERHELVHNREKWIENTLDSMTQGAIENLVQKFKQERCVICLEDFEKGCQACITNECFHTFHIHCLKEWYCSIDKNDQLSCAHCKKVNKPLKQKKEPLPQYTRVVSPNVAVVDLSNSHSQLERELRERNNVRISNDLQVEPL